MFYLNDVRYVKVWDVMPKDNYVDVRVSTSDKKQDGSYENSSWTVRLVGQATEPGRTLEKEDTFTINKGKVSNVYVKEKQQTYLNVVAFDITVPEKNQQPEQNNMSGFQAIDDSSDIPF